MSSGPWEVLCPPCGDPEASLILTYSPGEERRGEAMAGALSTEWGSFICLVDFIRLSIQSQMQSHLTCLVSSY